MATFKIRFGSTRKDGTKAIFLETYHGHTIIDGKIKANRPRVNIPGLYIYAKPRTKVQKVHNDEVKRQAEAYVIKIQHELNQGLYKVAGMAKTGVDLIAYMEGLAAKREKSGTSENWRSAIKHLKGYAGPVISFKQVDVKFCEGFKAYLQKSAITKSDKNLSSSSVASYFVKLRAALRSAVKDGYMATNPASEVETPRVKESKREYLTEEELQAAYNTPCRYDYLKRGFLFSCLTGMRWSDITKLQWKDVRKHTNGTWQVVFHQRKTDSLQYHSINQQARDFMGVERGPEDLVFMGLKYSSYMNVELSRWMLAAGITKHITFHCGRHTYAILQISNGTEVYTVSKLLGHKELRTTEIYLQIIDKKKVEAANNLPTLKISL